MSSDTEASSSAPCVPLNKKRWNKLRRILERPGPFYKNDFTASPDNLEFLQKTCKVLVIGAGGLGCELLKDLAMMGFGNLHVIDMDTVELSNLNRQFLFRQKDIGDSKAECAASFINTRVPTCSVVPHFSKIEDLDGSFYKQFHIIVCGLDSIAARRWINGMLFSMLSYNEDGTVDPSTVIPLIDGGTEGFKGKMRVIIPGFTACMECTLGLFPSQITYPLCTIANTPRLPEHCIEYVKILQWNKKNPFNMPLDGDDPRHVSWVYERAQERANKFNISGITYRLVLGLIKNIIPAVASTNAVIAAACTTEVFKLATSCYDSMSNYMIFNDTDVIYTYTYEAENANHCLVCSKVHQTLHIENPNATTLGDLIKMLCDSSRFKMKISSMSAMVGGKNKTLYMSNVKIKSIEEQTRQNLTLSLVELDLIDGQIITVTGTTTPSKIELKLKYKTDDESAMK